MLLFRLLKEQARGRASVFWRYMKTMPTSYPSMLSDKEEQRHCLAGTPAASHVKRRFTRDEAFGRLMRGCHVALSQPVFEWAKLTMDTRAFSGTLPSGTRHANSARKEWNAFVPFCDIFNDAIEPVASWSRDEKTGDFKVVASKFVRGGDEVTISYGAKSNDKLLSSYGFVHPDNPRDEVVIHLEDGNSGTMPPSISLSLGKLEPGYLRQGISRLQDVRMRIGHERKSRSRQEREVQTLEVLRNRCDTAGRNWAWTVGGEGGANDWMCAGYRGGLVSIAKACADFAENAIAEIQGLPAKALEGSSGRLAGALLGVWQEDFRKIQ
mmetsp:Transcript_147310/g.470909  ORF Transcript_147310/g.470909 Transcript_147310/m.470909 type:complete len:324 (-) Transcript_147310:430-1401(-)